MTFQLGKANGHPFAYRGKAALAHILFSIVFLAIPLIAITWHAYPGSLFWGDGGAQLIKIALGVDLVLGPSLTFLAFSPTKKIKPLALDITIILILQLSAFGYGFNSMWVQRPAAVVYSERAFRSISHVQMMEEPNPQVAKQIGSIGAPQLFYRFPSTKVAELQRFLTDAQSDGRAYTVRSSHWTTMAQMTQQDVERMGKDDMLLTHIQNPEERKEISDWIAKQPNPKRLKLYALGMRYKNNVVAFDLDKREIVKYFDIDPGNLMTL